PAHHPGIPQCAVMPCQLHLQPVEKTGFSKATFHSPLLRFSTRGSRGFRTFAASKSAQAFRTISNSRRVGTDRKIPMCSKHSSCRSMLRSEAVVRNLEDKKQ